MTSRLCGSRELARTRGDESTVLHQYGVVLYCISDSTAPACNIVKSIWKT